MSFTRTAAGWQEALAAKAAAIDLRNGGRPRSAYVLDGFFFELVEYAAPGLFVEAGAFDANASRRVAATLPECTVLAFEANPNNHAIWTSEVDFGAERVDYRHSALANRTGEIEMVLRTRDPGAAEAHVEDNSIHPWIASAAGATSDVVMVPVTTMDGILAEVPTGTRVATWIDVEGANREVIDGGRGLLAACDVVKIEVESSPLWVGQWLDLDVLGALTDLGLVPLARDAQAPEQYNVVLVSTRLAGDPHVGALLAAYERRQAARELPGILGKARRHPLLRQAARSVRDRLPRPR
ncbi:MAG: FkbM family methyltransferase [Tetrasphaera sp.]|nr:FkbM family methyltransferase [Tetrasphaera sp.]